MTVQRSDENVRGCNLSYFTMAMFSGQFLTSFTEFIERGTHGVFLVCLALVGVAAFALFIFGAVNKNV
jgi:hypothetical protein